MSSPILPLLALALIGVSQAAPDPIADTRAQLEAQRHELDANIADKAWMSDSARATIVRLAVERNWKTCAANEGTAQARNSDRPARLLAEAALAACHPWEDALVLALRNGADPYVNGTVSHEDMVAEVRLQSRDAALDRIFLWRGISTSPVQPGVVTRSSAQGGSLLVTRSAPLATSVLLDPFPKGPAHDAPAPAAARPEPKSNEAELVVVAQTRNRCDVRLADRTLSETQLAEQAKQWAAAGTALRIVRPRGANYGCIAKIARHLNQYGVSLIQVVDP